MPGHLFTNYFLTDGIRVTPEWRAGVASAQEFEAFRNGVRQRYGVLSRSQGPNEAVTEQELIRPVLDMLGWTDYLPQQGDALVAGSPAHRPYPHTCRISVADGTTIAEGISPVAMLLGDA